MNFSQKFLELRKNSGLSQEEAADKLGVSRQAISRWEQGTAYPDSFNLLQISKLFGVSADYLIDDERKSDEKTLPQELSSSGRQSDEIVQSPQLPDDGRRALRAAAWPYLTACAICVVLLNIIGIVVAFYANAAAGTVVLSFAAAVAIAGIVAAAIIYRPAPVHKSGNISAERSGRTSLYLSLMVCFHIGALILELVGFVLLFCYSDAILTNILTGFGVLLTVAGCITFECVFHSRPVQLRKSLRKKYYRISVWLFSPFLIMNVLFVIAMNSGGHVVIGGVIVGSLIIYVAVCVLVTLLLRERKNK